MVGEPFLSESFKRIDSRTRVGLHFTTSVCVFVITSLPLVMLRLLNPLFKISVYGSQFHIQFFFVEGETMPECILLWVEGAESRYFLVWSEVVGGTAWLKKETDTWIIINTSGIRKKKLKFLPLRYSSCESPVITASRQCAMAAVEII